MRLSHITWNLGGLVIPLAVAAVTVPALIDTLGPERFGLLALAWGLIGYAGALDLGIGRALTQMISRLHGEQSLANIPAAVATAGRITLIAGLVGSALIALVALLDGYTVFKITSTPPQELQIASLLLAIALPAQAMSATYRAVNEAYLNFQGINILRALLGVINFAGPYAVSLYTTQIPWLVATLVVSRLVALLVYRQLALACLQQSHQTRLAAPFSGSIAKELFSFGTWITVSSIISPILVQADRFLIASIISAAAVSAYVLPYEVVVQSLVVVGALSSVMFPTLSRLMQEQPDKWRSYFKKWLLRVSVLMAGVCLTLAMALQVVLPLWIKTNLHPQSVQIGQILCLGVFANALGSMYYAALHAKGRADLTAKLHLIELPLFLLTLTVLIQTHGLIGAAWAWVMRMIFDALILSRLAAKP